MRAFGILAVGRDGRHGRHERRAGFDDRFVGALGADVVLGLTVRAKDLTRGHFGAATERTLPLHGAAGIAPAT